MARFLTPEEWQAVKPPFSYLRFRKLDKDAAVYQDMMRKWIEANCSGWVWDGGGDTYVFEHKSDMMLFAIWLKSDPFAAEHGDVMDA